MKPYPTVVLHHVNGLDSHYDWLLQAPPGVLPDTPGSLNTEAGREKGLLWTARIEHPPWRWQSMGHMKIQPIAPHRRAYLTYQGAVSHQRGTVLRVASGHYLPLQWTSSDAVLQIHWHHPLAEHDTCVQWHFGLPGVEGHFFTADQPTS